MIAAGEHSRQHDFDQGHDLRVERLPLTLKDWGILSRGGPSWLFAGDPFGLRRLIEAERIGMLHCGRCLPEGVMALAIKLMSRIPYACYVHGEDVTTAADSREYAWLVRRVLKNASYVIANSQNTARILREDWRFPRDRLVVLHPGVDTRRFVPVSRDPRVRSCPGLDGSAGGPDRGTTPTPQGPRPDDPGDTHDSRGRARCPLRDRRRRRGTTAAGGSRRERGTGRTCPVPGRGRG